MNFSQRVIDVFSKMETSYDEIKNLMFDLYKGELGEGITKAKVTARLTQLVKTGAAEKEIMKEFSIPLKGRGQTF